MKYYEKENRLREMAIEDNKGNDFRVYKNIDKAEKWILSWGEWRVLP